MNDRISRNLDILERSVNECGKTTIEDAAIAGKDLDSMNNDQLNRFRGLTGRYKEKCVCMKTITRKEAEEKGKEVSASLQKFAKIATEKGKVKYEEISTKARPTLEQLKEKSKTEYGKASTKAMQIIQQIRERAKSKAESS